MTTITVQTSYTWNTVIHSKGKQTKGEGWVLAVTAPWRSDWPLSLYGQDWTQLQGFDAGDEVIVTIDRGSVKRDKMGDAPWEYFWNLRSMTRAELDWSDPRAMEPDPIPQPMPDPIPQPIPDPRAKQIAWNSAVNNAVHLIGPMPMSTYAMDSDGLGQLAHQIQKVADMVYQIITVGPAPEMPLDGPEMDVEAVVEEEPTSESPIPMNPVEYIREVAGQFNADARVGKGTLVTPGLLREYIEQHYEVDSDQKLEAIIESMSSDQVLSLAAAISRGEVQ